MVQYASTGYLFQSTLSVRRATFGKAGISAYNSLFQSTLSVRRATIQPVDTTII